ncbi:MAG: hypothetical protein QM666_11410 [Acinetobacter sp.]
MSNQQPKKSNPWKGVIIACILGAVFMGFLWYSLSSDNDRIQQYSKDWKSTGDVSQPQMSHDDMAKMHADGSASEVTMDMSKMKHDGMAASEMQHMDMADSAAKKTP